jgi:hypothetical protein
MSWLANRLGIHLNLRPLAAPAGALIGGLLGGPVGAGIGAGLFKTADNKAHGDSWTHALGQGALNGVGYGVGTAGLDKLRSAFTPGSMAGASGTAPSAFTSGVDTGTGGWVADGANAAARAVPQGGSSLLSAVGNGAKTAGSWLAAHPSAVSGTLQGVGQIGSMESENAFRKAQADALKTNTAQSQYDLEIKKRRDAALAPLLAAFQGNLQRPYSVAANPYS